MGRRSSGVVASFPSRCEFLKSASTRSSSSRESCFALHLKRLTKAELSGFLRSWRQYGEENRTSQ